MKYTIFGFQQFKLIQYGLSLEEVFLLKVLKDVYPSAKMESLIENNQRYIWIKYSRLAEEVPILGSIRNIKRKMEKLEAKGLIERVIKHKKNNKGGSYAYIRLTELTDTLSDYEIDKKSKKDWDDNIDMGGMTELSSGVCQSCHTKDNMFIDNINTNNKQQRKTQYNNFLKLVDVVFDKRNIFKEGSLYNQTKNILENFYSITNKIPGEKDVTDSFEILTDPLGKKLEIDKRVNLIIKTMQKIQNTSPDKKINSINYFKVPILNEFKNYKVFKIDDKLY